MDDALLLSLSIVDRRGSSKIMSKDKDETCMIDNFQADNFAYFWYSITMVSPA